MIVSHELKLLFVHIPKTGGGTIAKIIRDQDPSFDVIGSSHMGLSPEVAEKYKDYFKFCFVRNPWEQVISTDPVTDAMVTSAPARLSTSMIATASRSSVPSATGTRTCVDIQTS